MPPLFYFNDPLLLELMTHASAAAFLVGQTKRTFIREAKPYISHRAIIIPHNFPRVGLSSRTKKKVRNEPRERLSALRSPSGRGKPDKRAGVGDGEREMRGKRDRQRERCRLVSYTVEWAVGEVIQRIKK